jgi:uncharacterized peroxidase-related enzyme
MFLNDADSPQAAAFLEKERAASGYVMNLERVWAWRPDVSDAFAATRKLLMDGSTLTLREFAVLVCAGACALGDSYCALAWGTRLAQLADPLIAADVLRGIESPGLTARERALRTWAGQMVQAPGETVPAQVDALRAAGLTEKEVVEATMFVALRLAFSTVNDALGARPDAQLVRAAPPEVLAAVTYGRPPAAA